MSDLTRNNHYVPQWYQKGFIQKNNQLVLQDLHPDPIHLPTGETKIPHGRKTRSTTQCFCEIDLYTTSIGGQISDRLERTLFGTIDDAGARAVRAYAGQDPNQWHKNFESFFRYMSAQVLRTPKGLAWLERQYGALSKDALLQEMAIVRDRFFTLWVESVKEVVSSKGASTKFIVTDHPVAFYNPALPPGPDEELPEVSLHGTQTVFPLDQDHCLILTHLDYAHDPTLEPMSQRTHAKPVRPTMARTDAVITSRELTDKEVMGINTILRSQARRFIAAGHPRDIPPPCGGPVEWGELRAVLAAPKDELFPFGGEIIVGYDGGASYYQDPYGRKTRSHEYLAKEPPQGKVGRNKGCPCGSGRKYKRCCEPIPPHLRRPWDVKGIRERNLMLLAFIRGKLSETTGVPNPSWETMRKGLTNDVIQSIYEVYEGLWPPDTDLLQLLPKPDGTLRAVFTGHIDPRTLPSVAVGVCSYVEDLIVVNPLMNPSQVIPDYNPIKHPQEHRIVTIKALSTLLLLEPLIESGQVTLIPAPDQLDIALRGMLHGSGPATPGVGRVPYEESRELINIMCEDNIRAMAHLPPQAALSVVHRAYPGCPRSFAEKVVKAVMEGPGNGLVDLGPITDRSDKQIFSVMASPGTELSLYLAMATGAFVITDSPSQWMGLNLYGNIGSAQPDSSYDALLAAMPDRPVPLSRDPYRVVETSSAAPIAGFRRGLSSAVRAIHSGDPDVQIATATVSGLCTGPVMDGSLRKALADDGACSSQLQALAPLDGFRSTKAARFLFQSGALYRWDSVPLALYFKRPMC